MPSYRHRSAVAGVLLLGAAACDSADRQPEQWWTISQEPQIAIGQTMGDLPYLFERIADARLLEGGQVLVADAGPPSLRIFAPDGEFLAELGGAGEGPGELASISGVWTRGDTIGVFDSRSRRLTTYLTDGSQLETVRVQAPEAGPRARLDFMVGRLGDGSVVLAWTVAESRTVPGVRPDRTVLGRFGADGHFLNEIGVGGGLERYENTVLPFSAYPRAAVLGDSVYFTDGRSPSVTIWSASNGVGRELGLTLPSHTVTDAVTALEGRLGADWVDPVGMPLRDIPRPDSVPRIGGLLLDDTGLLWVKPYDPAADALWVGNPARPTGGDWWIFDRAGRGIAGVSMPNHLAPLDVSADRLLALTTDEFDVERIVVHEIGR